MITSPTIMAKANTRSSRLVKNKQNMNATALMIPGRLANWAIFGKGDCIMQVNEHSHNRNISSASSQTQESLKTP